jgi:CubicO group peptidase (beta-lactamase class C family)
VHSGSLLTDGSLRALRTIHTPLSSLQDSPDDWLRGDGYGYGLYIGSVGGHTAYFHPGDIPGYQSFSAWLPEHAISVAILSNEESANIEDLLRHLLAAALEP